MRNEIYGSLKALVFADTDMNKEEFACLFDKDSILDQFLLLTDIHGKVHKFQISTFLELAWEQKENSHSLGTAWVSVVGLSYVLISLYINFITLGENEK